MQRARTEGNELLLDRLSLQTQCSVSSSDDEEGAADHPTNYVRSHPGGKREGKVSRGLPTDSKLTTWWLERNQSLYSLFQDLACLWVKRPGTAPERPLRVLPECPLDPVAGGLFLNLPTQEGEIR